MTYRLVLCIPIRQKTINFHTINGNINPNIAIDLAYDMMPHCRELITMYRQKYQRSYKFMPKFLRFHIIRGGQPNVEKTREIGRFEIPLDGSEMRVVREWR
jgi:hypothetical protein